MKTPFLTALIALALSLPLAHAAQHTSDETMKPDSEMTAPADEGKQERIEKKEKEEMMMEEKEQEMQKEGSDAPKAPRSGYGY